MREAQDALEAVVCELRQRFVHALVAGVISELDIEVDDRANGMITPAERGHVKRSPLQLRRVGWRGIVFGWGRGGGRGGG